MIAFLLGRLASALVVVLGVSCLVFSLIHLVPGDPVEVMLGESASSADREQMRIALGLDRPIPIQLLDFLRSLTRLDLGVSLHSREPVLDLVLERLPATAELAAASLLVALALALPLGTLAATRRNTGWDAGAMGFSMLGVSIPNFVLGPVLILMFAFWLQWAPVSGRESWASLILPALTLGTALAAVLARMVRASLLEVLGEDFMRTARAKGLSHAAAVFRHALPNAALPLVTVLGLQLGAVLGGAVITEFVFSWPGLGTLTIESIAKRDYPVLQGCVLTIATVYVVLNTLTDLVYGWLDPRVRLTDSA